MTTRMRMALLLSAFFAFGAVGVGQVGKPQPDENGVYAGWNGVWTATLVHPVPAIASDDPRLKGSKRVCGLLVEAGADGVPKTVAVANRVASPFDDVAITAVLQSQFEPGTLKGKPVPTRFMMWVPFIDGHPAVPVGGGSPPWKKPAGLKTLTNPVPIYTPPVELSDEARRDHYAGYVVIQVLIDEDGSPTHARLLVRAGKGMDDNALAAVSKWRFKPATLEEVPVPFLMIAEAAFR